MDISVVVPLYDEVESLPELTSWISRVMDENRFTYEAKGLHKIIDLGDYWESKTNNPIPLGGIVINRNIDLALQQKVDGLIKKSILYAYSNYPALNDYIRSHSQEMSEDVMRKHIQLYVNDYTTDLGERGEKAIATLFEKAGEGGLIAEDKNLNIFY